jgi:hypothetical protein
MSPVTCPRCGFVQEGGEECGRCGVLFRRAAPAPASRPTNATARPAPRPTAAPLPSRDQGPSEAGPSLFRRVYRVVRWAVLAVLVVVVILMLRQRPAPEAPPDPEAPRRIEAKLNEEARATAAGQPHTLAMDDGEVNAWLHKSLDLQPAPGAPSPSMPADRSEPMTVEEVRSNVRDVRVRLGEDRLTLWVLFDFHGKDLTLTLEAQLSVRDHRLQITPTAGWLGQLPLPHATLERAVGRALADPANAEKLDLPPDVVDVRIQGGELFVDFAGGVTAPVRLTPPATPLGETTGEAPTTMDAEPRPDPTAETPPEP